MKKSSGEYVSTLGTGLRLKLGVKEGDRVHIEVERRKLDKETGEFHVHTNERTVLAKDLPRILKCYKEVK